MTDEQTTTIDAQPEAEAAAEPAKPKTILEEIEAETPSLPEIKKGKGKIEYRALAKDEIKPGMMIRVHQKIIDINTKGEEKERVQVFQGMVLAHQHGTEAGATITVRKISEGIGVEKIYPLAMPSIVKFELVRQFQTHQAKPYFLRGYKKKLKEIK